jgi:hypothetical protein
MTVLPVYYIPPSPMQPEPHDDADRYGLYNILMMSEMMKIDD